jgi:hypothetical protein
VINMLGRFSSDSGLQLNWNKLTAYFWELGGRRRPDWTNTLDLQWAQEDDVARLLGTPFGLTLGQEGVDQFLIERIDKKLKYWSAMHINNAGRAMVGNGILISSVFFFLAIWGGSKKGVSKVKAKIRNYIWSGSAHPTRARVSWDVCCMLKKEGGLGIVDPHDALTALMYK